MQILEIFADLPTGFNASTTRLLDQISTELMLIVAGKRRPVKSTHPERVLDVDQKEIHVPPNGCWMPIKNMQILEIFADLLPGFNASTARLLGQISTELILIVAGRRRPVQSTPPEPRVLDAGQKRL